MLCRPTWRSPNMCKFRVTEYSERLQPTDTIRRAAKKTKNPKKAVCRPASAGRMGRLAPHCRRQGSRVESPMEGDDRGTQATKIDVLPDVLPRVCLDNEKTPVLTKRRFPHAPERCAIHVPRAPRAPGCLDKQVPGPAASDILGVLSVLSGDSRGA